MVADFYEHSLRTPKIYKTPRWLEILIILSLMASISGFSRITGYNAGFEARAKYEAYLVPIHAAASSTPLILPKTGVTGVASWYDYSLSGIDWSKGHDTCAMRDFKRYSTVRVTNLANGKTVDCYINDYGPETCEQRIAKGLDKPEECIERIIDLSSHAFATIADLGIGLINVSIEEINN